MASHQAATAATPTTIAARRAAFLHFLAAIVSTMYPFAGATGLPTPVQCVQIAVGVLGAVGTYAKGGQAFKVAIPALTGALIAAAPMLDGLAWDEVTRATLIAAAVHFLAAVGNGLFPNDTAAATSPTPRVVAAAVPTQATGPVVETYTVPATGTDLASLARVPRAADDENLNTSQFYAFAPAPAPESAGQS